MSEAKFKLTRNTTANDIVRRLRFLVKSKIYVGVQGENITRKDSDEPTNVQIAIKNEFGTEKIPERSFIRASVRENAKKYNNFNRTTFNKILKGEVFDINEALGKLGIVARDDMEGFGVALQSPPNSPTTIEKKGSANPLVATSQMLNSITYVVENES